MRATHRLARELQLTILPTDRGNFSISAADDYGTMIPADRLVSFFFFADDTSLFGLTVPTEDNHMILQPHEWVQAFSGNRHPYISYKGATERDDVQLSAVEEAATLWLSKDLWSYTKPDAEQIIHFSGAAAGLSESAASLTKQAIATKFQSLGVRADMVTALLPHLQHYGWPGETKSDMPIRPALRLTEPDAEGTEDWLLETVILNERGTQWTLQNRSRTLRLKVRYLLNGSHLLRPSQSSNRK